jgi:hypothetical protein
VTAALRPALHRVAIVVLVLVAAVGAVLSWQSLYLGALPVFGPALAPALPLMVDGLVLGASLQFVATVKAGRPMPAWRVTAHAGVAVTITLNAMAAPSAGVIAWHVAAPPSGRCW